MIVAAHFFSDEAGGLCGPYLSAEEARMAEETYGKFLSNGPDSVPSEDRARVGEAMVRADDLKGQIILACGVSIVAMQRASVDTVGRKCEDVLRNVVDRCNEQAAAQMGDSPNVPVVGFGPDWGGNSLTIYVGGKGHSHVGSVSDDATFEQLVDQLRDLLVRGRGLSFVA